jgi:ATP-dependent DNA ligase
VYSNDWNILADIVVPIDPSWIVQDGVRLIPPGVECQYWVETGFVDGKITRHQPNFSEAKCVGRKNERSVLLQGMMDARSDWVKYKKKGYSEDGETRVSLRPWPMLAQIYKKRYNKVGFPVLVQPKLNGVRCLAHKLPGRGYLYDVDLYTRNQTEWLGMPQFRTQLASLPPGMIVDGEIYGRRSRLNEIQGWSSDEQKSLAATLENTDIRYYVYDIFNPTDGADWMCSQRETLVNQLFKVDDEKFTGDFTVPAGTKHWDIITDEQAIKEANKDYQRHATRSASGSELNQPFDSIEEWARVIQEINTSDWKAKFTFIEYGWLVRTPTILVRSKAELLIAYYTLLVAGYEGLMVRTIRGIYSTSTTSNKTRSNDLMKFKPISDNEYPIIGFTCGSGRDQDALIWKCTTGNSEFYFP